jgi:hypothetical protein
MAIQYPSMLRELLEKHSDLAAQRNRIDVEMTKLTQLIRAAFNMLTPEEKAQAEAADFEKFLESYSLGLTSAVKMAFEAHKDEWLTPPEIRDYLNKIGFDFKKYIANPLTSIGTTLKRMGDFEIETKTMGSGQIAYRLKTFSPWEQLLSVGTLRTNAPAPAYKFPRRKPTTVPPPKE